MGPAAAQEATPAETAPAGARIVISLADRRLYLTGPDGGTRSFPVAIGRPGVPIPTGDSSVVRKRRNPTWRPTAHQRRDKPSLPPAVPPGPHNPLGRFALDLGWPAIAIHGTNEPDSIGRQASGGCFRMLPTDIETVFAATAVGTPVQVVRASLAAPAAVRPPVPAVTAAAPPPVAVRPAAPSAAAPAPIAPAAAPSPPPEPIPDPRCGSVTAPLRRMICDTPALALLDGRARGVQERFLAGLADPPARAAAAYALIQDERRFHERVSALCWIRSGTEADPAVAAAAQSCLSHALDQRLTDIAERIAGLNGRAHLASRP
ncbi:hypothetical protein TSO352_03140 [Azospirillum sp. TSO35-2]|nr:hypothetical protein TSO352_03140 [Azospirillum sp. TSO35-2]